MNTVDNKIGRRATSSWGAPRKANKRAAAKAVRQATRKGIQLEA